MSGMIVLLVAVVATMSVQGGNLFDGPTRCFFPDQYSVYMTLANAITPKAMPTVMFQNDLKAKKLVMVNMTTSAPAHRSANTTGKVLIDFNKKLLYVVPAGHPEKCRKIPYTEEQHKRIPADATYVTSSYMGFPGQMVFDVWRIKFHLTHRTAPAKSPGVTFAISRLDCVPLMEMVQINGSPSRNSGQVFVYTGFQKKLLAPSLFDLPPSCDK
ncbi:hypothetical protein ACOMHN_026746 [Nucella lapillus]